MLYGYLFGHTLFIRISESMLRGINSRTMKKKYCVYSQTRFTKFHLFPYSKCHVTAYYSTKPGKFRRANMLHDNILSHTLFIGLSESMLNGMNIRTKKNNYILHKLS